VEILDAGLVSLALVFCVVRPFIVQAFYIPSQSMERTLLVDDRILVDKLVYRFHPPRRGDIVVFDPPTAATLRHGETWIKRVVGLPGDRICVRGNHLHLNGRIQAEPYVTLCDSGSQAVSPEIGAQKAGRYAYVFPDPDALDGPGEDGLQQGKNTIVSSRLDAGPSEDRVPAATTAETTPSSKGDYLFFIRNTPKDGLEVVVPPGKLFVMGDNRNNSDDSHYWGCLEASRVIGRAFCVFWPIRHARMLIPRPDRVQAERKRGLERPKMGSQKTSAAA
jgi:signal peptidase I